MTISPKRWLASWRAKRKTQKTATPLSPRSTNVNGGRSVTFQDLELLGISVLKGKPQCLSHPEGQQSEQIIPDPQVKPPMSDDS